MLVGVSVAMDTKCDGREPHLHPVGQPVALGVGALHREQDVAPGDDAALWYCLDLDGQVAIVFLPTGGQEISQATQRKRKSKKKERPSFCETCSNAEMH